MAKKIEFKTASTIRARQAQQIPEEVSKKVDEWIFSTSNEPAPTQENNQIASPRDPYPWQDMNTDKNQEGKTIRLNINISVQLHKSIKKACADQEISITDFVTQLLEGRLGS